MPFEAAVRGSEEAAVGELEHQDFDGLCIALLAVAGNQKTCKSEKLLGLQV